MTQFTRYREYAWWQSRDLTWNLGFFPLISEEDGSCSTTPRYDLTRFSYLVTGHEKEYDVWENVEVGPPAFASKLPYATNSALSAKYDRLAVERSEEVRA